MYCKQQKSGRGLEMRLASGTTLWEKPKNVVSFQHAPPLNGGGGGGGGGVKGGKRLPIPRMQ